MFVDPNIKYGCMAYQVLAPEGTVFRLFSHVEMTTVPSVGRWHGVDAWYTILADYYGST